MQNFLKLILKKLSSKFFRKEKFKRELDYYEYINKTKQFYCNHQNLKRISNLKFYCIDCGKYFKFLEDEVIIFTNLFFLLIIGSLFYIFLNKKKS